MTHQISNTEAQNTLPKYKMWEVQQRVWDGNEYQWHWHAGVFFSPVMADAYMIKVDRYQPENYRIVGFEAEMTQAMVDKMSLTNEMDFISHNNTHIVEYHGQGGKATKTLTDAANILGFSFAGYTDFDPVWDMIEDLPGFDPDARQDMGDVRT